MMSYFIYLMLSDISKEKSTSPEEEIDDNEVQEVLAMQLGLLKDSIIQEEGNQDGEDVKEEQWDDVYPEEVCWTKEEDENDENDEKEGNEQEPQAEPEEGGVKEEEDEVVEDEEKSERKSKRRSRSRSQRRRKQRSRRRRRRSDDDEDVPWKDTCKMLIRERLIK